MKKNVKIDRDHVVFFTNRRIIASNGRYKVNKINKLIIVIDG